jgi:hypothetical protein
VKEEKNSTGPCNGVFRVRIIMYPENWTGNEDSMLCPWESAEEVRRRAMSTQRKHYSAACKALALEALKGLKTVNA